MKKYFVTGIGTEVGKTIVSAVLVEALQADYFKPIQCGDLHFTDTQKVKALVNKKLVFHPENYALKKPASPHDAAAEEGVTIALENFRLPHTNNHLIVEGAGGVMVPLNKGTMMLDLMASFDLEVILVSRNYLGSINHTLLSIAAIKNRGLKVKGIIFNGKSNPSTEEVILKYTGVPLLGHIPELPEVTPSVIAKYAQQFKNLGL